MYLLSLNIIQGENFHALQDFVFYIFANLGDKDVFIDSYHR